MTSSELENIQAAQIGAAGGKLGAGPASREEFPQGRINTNSTEENPQDLDSADPLSRFRGEFLLPINRDIGGDLVETQQLDEPCTYLCGNSLGLLAKESEKLIHEELTVWSSRGVDGHFFHPHQRPWKYTADETVPLLVDIVGAKPEEVATMGTLTANLHLMMTSFYKPTGTRFRILCEAKAFPSDQYAFASKVQAHGLDPEIAILELSPRPGEFTLREEDILSVIEKEGDSIALVLFSGVQFYTGQWFPIAKITEAGQKAGCIVGWDLAHAVGNVPLSLHDWGVDFAVWCTYKYLNSGPGGIGGIFVHEKWNETSSPVLAGWWGHDSQTRFAMPKTFSRIPGAAGFQQSNPSALLCASLLGSLRVFHDAGGIRAVREKSLKITAFLEALLHSSAFFVPIADIPSNANVKPWFTIITPSAPEERGAQLSLLFGPPEREVMQRVFDGIKHHGIIGDERKPDVLRLSPAPLYNSFADCHRAAEVLELVLVDLSQHEDFQLS